MSDLTQADLQTRSAVDNVVKQEKQREVGPGERLCAWVLGVLVAFGCIAGISLMGWSLKNEREGPHVLYVLSPVTFLLFSGVIQFLLFGMQGSPSRRAEERQGSVRHFRLSPKLLTVGFAVGVSVPLMHTFSRLVLEILVLEPTTSPYQSFHEGVLATLAMGVIAIIGFLAYRMSHLDD